MYQLIVDILRNIKELVDMTALELQFERSMYFRIFVISNFRDTFGRNVGSMHL